MSEFLRSDMRLGGRIRGRVLVIDDEFEFARTFQQGLLIDGFQAEIAVPGHESSALLDKDWSGYDLVIIDKMMPIDYRALIEKAKKIPLPVILITSDPLVTPGDGGADFVASKLDIVGELGEFISKVLSGDTRWGRSLDH